METSWTDLRVSGAQDKGEEGTRRDSTADGVLTALQLALPTSQRMQGDLYNLSVRKVSILVT